MHYDISILTRSSLGLGERHDQNGVFGCQTHQYDHIVGLEVQLEGQPLGALTS